jgi:hypothetical protein
MLGNKVLDWLTYLPMNKNNMLFSAFCSTCGITGLNILTH